MLYDEGRREEAAAIYRKLAGARPDRRQTARRAQLRLAQVALAARDFAAAENSVQLALAGRAPADIQSRAQRLRTQIAYRRQIAAAETELEQVDALVTAGNLDAATGATQRLLVRACPYPPDYPARVKTRLARIYRAKGDFATARATALDAQASAQTPGIRQGTQELIAEIDAAALAAQLRGTITQANARIEFRRQPRGDRLARAARRPARSAAGDRCQRAPPARPRLCARPSGSTMRSPHSIRCSPAPRAPNRR